ncbi:MAG: hypothetical protein KDB18_13245, partial [Salinibacterium sp.]|nr:hypothetical protein [Salinibacterium sp.]
MIEHPMNQPCFDPDVGRVVAGYGILQPRISVTMASAEGSSFARVYAGHTGMDPYTTAVSDTYQDLFEEGSFTGKGLYHVDSFSAALEGRVAENSMLSHDLFEGLYARCALVTDVELWDDFPTSVLSHTRRLRRWVRGDWQLLPAMLRSLLGRRGREQRLPLISYWKVLDNLRRSLVAPTLLALLLSAWTWLRGPAWGWTLAALAVLGLPMLQPALDLFRGPSSTKPLRVLLSSAREDLKIAASQALLETMLLANRAYGMVQAVVVTIVRTVMTRRRLLEWETAATSSARSAGVFTRSAALVFLAEMWAGPTIALVATFAIWQLRVEALPIALPFLVAWMASPFVACWISRTPAPARPVLGQTDAAELRRIARRTWHYFDRFITLEDHWLPPDNVQSSTSLCIAHRTSPTNIGMGLLSTLAAHDYGFLDADMLADRISRTLATVEALERHEGHILNWYDTTNLDALGPRYVSTVESGNLAGALMTLAAGLREVAQSDEDPSLCLAGAADTAGVLAEVLLQLGHDAPAGSSLAENFERAERQLGDLQEDLATG